MHCMSKKCLLAKKDTVMISGHNNYPIMVNIIKIYIYSIYTRIRTGAGGRDYA
jgi:hypothetical protein